MKPGDFCSKAPILKGNPQAALCRWRVLHQGRRAQARDYAERELYWLLATRSAPIVLPTKPADPRRQCRPDQPARLAGRADCSPGGLFVGTDRLLGAPGSRQVAIDAQAARLLIRGGPCRHPPVAPTTLRGHGAKLDVKGPGETPVASTSFNANARAAAVSPKPKKYGR